MKNKFLIACTVCTIFIFYSFHLVKTNSVLKERIENQLNYIEELNQNVLVPLGLELDSLRLRSINNERFIEELWNNRQ